MMMHPSFTRLRAFATGEDTDRAYRNTADHLASCSACRERVALVRGVRAELAHTVDASVPDALWQTVQASVERGERVLLPLAAHQARARRGNRVGLIAAILAVLLFLPFFILPRATAEAESSNLVIGPEHPTRAATLTLRYRPTKRLSDQRVLNVRARYSTAHSGAFPYVATVGTLTRSRNGEFDGHVQLPDSAIYAVLAVEDPQAKVVDDHGEAWEVTVHGADDKPLFDALLARYGDVRFRNTRTARQVVQQMITHYPNSPETWWYKFEEEQQDANKAGVDSLRLAYRVKLEEFKTRIENAPNPSADELGGLVFFASILGDSVTERQNTDRLLRMYPKDPSAVQLTVFRLYDAYQGKPHELLQALDSLYRTGARAAQLAFSAYNLAVQLGDADAIRLWVDRDPRKNPVGYVPTTTAYLNTPALHDEGMRRLQHEIAELEAGRMSFDRPLTMNAAEWQNARLRYLAQQLGILGRAQLEAHDTAAALATLRKAGSKDWSPNRFRAFGDVLLATGDTSNAAREYAKVLADPSTSPAARDSIRQRIGERKELTSLINTARTEMIRYYRARMLAAWPIRNEMRLTDLNGKQVDVKLAGAPTFVAFWSRYCPPSLMQLKRLNAVAAQARSLGLRVFAITDEEPNAELSDFVHKQNLDLPIYSDVSREARNAFDNRGTPRYIILDAEGRIRFNDFGVDGLPGELAAVQK